MIKRKDQGEYEFHLNYPSAREVVLVGDFGANEESRVPMDRTKTGEWICRLHLNTGIYQFKYWVDGNWCLDEDPKACGAASFLSSSLIVTGQSNIASTYVG